MVRPGLLFAAGTVLMLAFMAATVVFADRCGPREPSIVFGTALKLAGC